MEKITGIIFFDGHCNLCNGLVNFVIRRDKKAHFRFCALQNTKAVESLTKYQIIKGIDSIIYLEKGLLYEKSSAVLRICRKLNWPWPFFFILVVIPSFIRNAVYDMVAKKRYKWFGRRANCRIPEPGIKDRFI